MASPSNGYLSNLGRELHLAAPQSAEILSELEGHIEDRVHELEAKGVAPADALSRTLRELGASRSIARQLYEVHSRGTWYHTALAALPHLLLSGVFALSLWASPGWVIALLLLALGVSFFGWKRGRPNWTYPWLGYWLVAPIMSWGLAMSAVGYGAWGVVTQGALPLSLPIYIASFVYFALSLWIVVRVVSKVARRDWVMASLTLLPVPFLAYWFFFFYDRPDVLPGGGQAAQGFGSSGAVVFLVLAIATAIFFRVGRRVLRAALLVITAPSVVVLAWLSFQGGPGFIAAFAFSVLALIVLLMPAFLHKPRRGEEMSAPSSNTG